MGSVVVLQCQQNIANVPQASTNSLLPHPRCATVSTPPLLRPTINRGLARRKGIIGKMEVASTSSSIFIHSVETIFFAKFIEFFNYSKDWFLNKYISIYSSIYLKKLESGESENVYRLFDKIQLLFCIIFLKILVSKIQYSLISRINTLPILVHLADSLWKFYTKIGFF